MNNPSSRPVSPRPSMAQAAPAKKKKKPRRWPYVLLSLAALSVLAVLLLPRLLVQQATQKPAETGTFITQQVQTTTLQDKMQQALMAGGNGGQGNVNQSGQANQAGQSTQSTQQGQSTQNQSGNQSSQNTTSQFDSQVMSNINTDSSAGQNNPQSSNQSSQINNQNNAQNQNVSQPNAQNQSSGQNSDSGSQSQPVQNNQQAQPPANDGRFRVQMSASEISGMINSGLVQGTAPEYRASIQGVSTTIQGGRARITVALLPRHLPDAFLNNLPGVTRDTPTVYLGGEMSLSVSGNTLTPTIHELSLGNFRVPMPFIQSAVAQTVRQQADQLLRLPNGQRASLDDVILDQGAVTLVGHVQ